MDAFTDPKVTEIVLMASSQIGKTESFIEAGRSRQFVSKCVAQGRIPTNPDETINLAKGKKILAEMKDQGSARVGPGMAKGKKQVTGMNNPGSPGTRPTLLRWIRRS